MVTYRRWSLTESFTNSNLTEEPFGILVRIKVTRGGHSRKLHCIWTFNNWCSCVQTILHVVCYVSESQFDRCLDQLFGIVLSPEDDMMLMEKYRSHDPKQSDMVNYRHFCEVIGAGEVEKCVWGGAEGQPGLNVKYEAVFKTFVT